jgi:hypothetical protein
MVDDMLFQSILFFCLPVLDLNSWLCAYYAGALPLEPLHQPFFALDIFQIESHTFVQVSLVVQVILLLMPSK